MTIDQQYIGEILVRRGALDHGKLDEVIQIVKERELDIRDFLVATQTIQEDKVVRALADEVNMEFMETILY